MFGFLAMMVKLSVFSSIEVCFLPCGHTHEDVDAMFSRFAFQVNLVRFSLLQIFKQACYTIPDLQDRLRASSAGDKVNPGTTRPYIYR